MKSIGPVHTLRVTAPDPTLDPADFDEDDDGYDYEVVHPEECPTYETFAGTTEYECAIGMLCTDIGLYWALGVQRWNEEPEHLQPGEHRIRAWADTWTIPGEATEYDSGIDILDPADPGTDAPEEAADPPASLTFL